MEIGTKVKMVNCIEAKIYGDKIWETSSKPWYLGDNKTQVVNLVGKKGGGFAVDCLEIIDGEKN